MPKIPTFTTEARPTAEVGSVTSNLQIPLNTVAGALKPLTDAVVKYKTAEQNASNKTEALELENKAVIKLNDLSQDISIKYTNSEGILENRGDTMSLLVKHLTVKYKLYLLIVIY